MKTKTEVTVIPDKLYFKIGEVADLVGVKPYVLRYWETEFPDIAPGKSRTNQRLYKRKEVEKVLLIRDLLYKEKFTINGARKRIKELERGNKIEEKEQQTSLFVEPLDQGFLKKMKADLESLLQILKSSDQWPVASGQ
ncbi:MAG: MerR family transcriptional regulator [Deltaproteobacteria bacterium]|nr:MerR family transcriptional regulator [Deltaproteobacteria bacterium]